MKVMFVSLGCDKNLVDTENMLGILNDRGFTFTDDEMEAEVIAVNTCCFIHDAKQESINTILEMAEHKKDGKCKILIVTGCLAHRYQDEITKEIPEVDAFIGTSSYDKIADVIEAVLDGRTYNSIEDTDRLPLVRSKRVVTTGGYYEYLKIAEGCDKHCTYCIIPKLRGRYRSRPMEQLLAEARELASESLAGRSFVVSGKFSRSRDEMKELIEMHGGRNLAAVSANVDYIVAGDNMGPAKLRKAEKLGVKIISEEEFIAMVGGQEAPAANGTEADSATTANTRGRNNGAPAATESGDGEPVQQGELF